MNDRDDLAETFASLVRNVEPWSSYTEGWNDALDIAEQRLRADLIDQHTLPLVPREEA